MCYADVTAMSDGTFIPHCYCGWSDELHTSETSAEAAAQRHQEEFEAAEIAYALGLT